MIGQLRCRPEDLIITAIADPNSDAASTCRFVEIHNSSDAGINMAGYALQRWTNGNRWTVRQEATST